MSDDACDTGQDTHGLADHGVLPDTAAIVTVCAAAYAELMGE
jgi:hypothetical protein